MDRVLSRRRGLRLWLVVVGVAALVVLVAWAMRGGRAEEAATGPSASPTGSGEVTTEPAQSPSAEPTTEPTPSDVPSQTPSRTRTPSPTKSSRTPTALVPVPVEPLESKPPVELTETADFGTGLAVEVAEMRAVTGEARVQGEIAGPAVWVKLRAVNRTNEAISLARAQVEVTYGPNRSPGIALGAPDVVPFPASLAAGGSATASYVYGVPLDQRDQVQIVVFYSTDAPLVVFEGAAP